MAHRATAGSSSIPLCHGVCDIRLLFFDRSSFFDSSLFYFAICRACRLLFFDRQSVLFFFILMLPCCLSLSSSRGHLDSKSSWMDTKGHHVLCLACCPLNMSMHAHTCALIHACQDGWRRPRTPRRSPFDSAFRWFLLHDDRRTQHLPVQNKGLCALGPRTSVSADRPLSSRRKSRTVRSDNI